METQILREDREWTCICDIVTRSKPCHSTFLTIGRNNHEDSSQVVCIYHYTYIVNLIELHLHCGPLQLKYWVLNRGKTVVYCRLVLFTSSPGEITLKYYSGNSLLINLSVHWSTGKKVHWKKITDHSVRFYIYGFGQAVWLKIRLKIMKALS